MPYGKVWKTSYIYGQKLYYGQNEGRPHTQDKDYQGVTVRREKELVGSSDTIIDWDRFNFFNISVGADTTISSVINLRENSDFIVLLTKDNSGIVRNLYFPSDWTWADSVAPTSLTMANEQIVFKVTYFGGVLRAYRDPQQTGLALFTSSTSGTVPASGGGTAKFLRADGTWVDPSLSGVLPSGGTTGQALTKNSNTNYDVTWSSFGGGVTDGDKGDVIVSGTGLVWTIDTGAVSLAKMADMATSSFLGRSTAGTGAPEVLSATTATSLLNVFSTSLKGLVPAPISSTGKFLKDDGTWASVTASSIKPHAPQVLTSGTAATYTVPANCTLILVEVVGGGGSGATPPGTGYYGGGGGGGGGYAKKFYTVTPGQTCTYTVGSTAAASTFTDGSVTITGGAGSSATNQNGGAGGTATNGDINIAGEKGGVGFKIPFGTLAGGSGGDSALGFGGAGTYSSGSNGGSYGGGGAGKGDSGSTGTGAAGVIIITEYY